MRVLSLLAVAVAGCYDPPVQDCQFMCPDNQCPGGLTCRSGVCRTADATGACTGSTGSSCPTPPTGCTLATTTSGLCLAACSAATDWNAASSACGAGTAWQIAVLDTANALSAGETALAPATTWIGLTRNTVLDWQWRTGGGTVSASSSDWSTDSGHSGTMLTNLCAALDHGKLYSDECDVAHAYACTMK